MNSRAVPFGVCALLLTLGGFLLWWILDRGQEWKSISLGGEKVTHVCWIHQGDAVLATAGKRLHCHAHPAGNSIATADLAAEVTAMLPTESGILIALDNGSLHLHEADGLTCLKSWTNTPAGIVHCLALSRDGNQVALGGDKGIVLWNRHNRAFAETLLPVPKKVVSLAWSSSVSITLTCSDTRLRTISLGDGEITESKKLGTPLEAIAADVNGRIVTGNKNGGVALWKRNLASAEMSRDTVGGAIESLSAAPNGKWIAAAGQDQRLHLCDFSGPTNPVVSLRGHKGRIYQVTVHPSSEWIATGSSDGTVKIWKTPS